MTIDRSWWALGLIALALPVLAGGLYAGTYFAVVVRVPLGVFLCPTSTGPASGSTGPPTVIFATYPRIPRQHWWLFGPMHTLDRQLRPSLWAPAPLPEATP
jgi:hypothetical protein